jgi:hypothetical protein
LQPQDGAHVPLLSVQAQESQVHLVQPQLSLWRGVFSTFVMVISWLLLTKAF